VLRVPGWGLWVSWWPGTTAAISRRHAFRRGSSGSGSHLRQRRRCSNVCALPVGGGQPPTCLSSGVRPSTVVPFHGTTSSSNQHAHRNAVIPPRNNALNAHSAGLSPSPPTLQCRFWSTVCGRQPSYESRNQTELHNRNHRVCVAGRCVVWCVWAVWCVCVWY